ncbi:MAG TPA: enoyl-CoA hydratase-related protein [Planctomycetota bacterium]
MPETLRVECDGELASIVFYRLKGPNIVSSAVLKELEAAWADLAVSKVRVCILRGDGKAFLAGADIREMAGFTPAAAREFSARGQRIFDAFESSEIVTIAAIHGACLGGGCELALACDIRIGSTGMQMGQPEVNLGLIPGWGATARLPRIVGTGWALRMLLSGEALLADAALASGLVTEIGPPEDVQPRAEKLARTILSRGPQAVRRTKQLARAALESSFSEALAAERLAFGTTFECSEASEGLKAFIEKRAAKFF